MRVAEPVAEVRSTSWPAGVPTVSVVVATHDRSAFLPELFAALARQDAPTGGFEVVVVDDGSTDDTWPVLGRLVAAAEQPVLALRLAATGGPSVPRNTGVAHARGRLVAMTDDDCLPDPGWVRALSGGIAGARVAQGRTLPDPAGPRSTWDRTIEVSAPSGLWETCNLAVDREAFLAAGGFPVLEVLGRRARGFGEDVLLGCRLAAGDGGAWVPDAVVSHRWLPSTYADHLRGRWRLGGFPYLARVAPELRDRCWHGVFLTRRTAATDAALVAVAVAAASRRAGPLAGALPWLLAYAVPAARRRPGRPLLWRLAQEVAADATAAAALGVGSVRHRRLLL